MNQVTEQRHAHGGGSPDGIPAAIASTILAGFDKHYRLFRQFSLQAKASFEEAEWARIHEAARERINAYQARVIETVERLEKNYPEAAADSSLWPRIKAAYISMLMNHLQAECAETFYNSVAYRVLHRDYYNNRHIFWRPTMSTAHLHGATPNYRSYYPLQDGLRRCLLQIITGFCLRNDFADLRRDIRWLQQAILRHRKKNWRARPNFQIQVLASLFYRNKAAYIVCRIINGDSQQALVIPLLLNEKLELYVDTALMRRKDVSIVFSFSRAYFLVDMEVPSAYVRFLLSIMPGKSPVDLYAMLGLQKQAKTLFYREMQYHLRHSQDNFQFAPGVRGMVMLVFTLPSFGFVFKIIRDHFDPPKTVTRKEVRDKYQLVKFHDRVGRLADTLEYSNVAIDLDRIEPSLLAELRSSTAASIDEVGDKLIIRHVYIERRMEPLDRFLAHADGSERQRAIRDYGQAIRDMAGANIFPGDMLKKNFGVTRTGRVVFYDYDEISYITQCNFRRIPPAPSYEEEMLDTAWYSVGANDVFPETFTPFFFNREDDLQLFMQYHSDLLDTDWWNRIKAGIEAGEQADVFPYSQKRRFALKHRN